LRWTNEIDFPLIFTDLTIAAGAQGKFIPADEPDRGQYLRNIVCIYQSLMSVAEKKETTTKDKLAAFFQN
jgi:hypothetical protein